MGESEFGFVPNLEDLTFGEYIDIDNHLRHSASSQSYGCAIPPYQAEDKRQIHSL